VVEKTGEVAVVEGKTSPSNFVLIVIQCKGSDDNIWAWVVMNVGVPRRR
jgi:hypothetical protein